MYYKEFISKISFRYIKPNLPFPIFIITIYKKLDHRLPIILSTFLEYFNVKFPKLEKKRKRNLFYYLKKIPGMSTFTIGYLINKGVSLMPRDTVFLNIGVWHGFTFLSGMIGNPNKICIGIDNFSQFNGPKQEFFRRFNKFKSKDHFFYEIDYIEYFKNNHKKTIGFYLYDGPHEYEHQLRGLQIAEPFFSDNCIIMIDDFRFQSVRSATYEFISNSSNNYEILLETIPITESHPTFWNGLIIFRKIN